MRCIKTKEGEVFGNLTVIEKDFSKNKPAWKCLCSCGNYKIVIDNNLRTGQTKSCGCLNREKAKIMGKNNKIIDVLSYFESKISKKDCWEWLSIKDKDGYGIVGIKEHSDIHKGKAHRLSYLLHNGEYDTELWVLHTCDNTSCVNPRHLFLGTTQDNTNDRHTKGRSAKGEEIKNSKLTEKDVINIRNRKKEPRQILADEYRVSRNTISRIINRITWKHL